MRSLQIGATGMTAQQSNVETIANNLANMTTTGYKKVRAEFQDLLYQHQRRVGSVAAENGAIVPTGIQMGLGARLAAVSPDMSQGTLIQTGNKLDLAIQGDGFFAITLPNNEVAYTRDGSFKIGSDGTVVTSDGFTIQPGLVIPEDAYKIEVNSNGELYVYFQGTNQQPQLVGQFEMYRFINSAGLERMGDNMLMETTASGAPQQGTPGQVGFGSIRAGFLESSNVNPVTEITNMITAQRAYEMNSKVISTSDEMMSTVSNMR
jgi:flagellar basal-body rod protein FlgG